MSELPVNFHSEQNYDCVQCGRGCHNEWNINVSAERVAALRETELARDVSARFGDPFRPLENRTDFFLNRKPNGHCVFLEDGTGEHQGCLRCGIHAHIGYEAKPTTCKNFPFIVVETPDEVRVGASFFCTAVQQNVGRPLSVHQHALHEFGPSERMFIGKKPIRLYQDITTDWAGYKVLVQFLETLEPGDSYETRLARALLGLSRCILRAEEGASLTAAELQTALSAAPPDLPAKIWFQDQMTTCLHGITLFIECNEPEEIQALIAPLFGGGDVKLPAIGWQGPSQDLLDFRQQPLPEELQSEVDRYFRAVLFRHYLATHGHLLQSLITLYLNSSLIRQYSRLLAAVANEPLSRKAVYGALDRCEHDLMYHGKGFERLWRTFAEALLAQLAQPED